MFFRKKPEAPQPPPDCADCENQLAFLKQQNARLAKDCGPALKENARLRYQLAQCQRDRRVLEMQVSGARAELQAAMNLLARAQARPPEERLAAAALALAELGERLGLAGPWSALRSEARALDPGAAFAPEDWLRQEALGVLALAERSLTERARAEAHPAAALAEEGPLARLLDALRRLAGVA